MKIIFNGSPEDIDFDSGVVMSINWDALLPTISDYVRLRPDETIQGVEVSDFDLKVKIGKKKGRKTKS